MPPEPAAAAGGPSATGRFATTGGFATAGRSAPPRALAAPRPPRAPKTVSVLAPRRPSGGGPPGPVGPRRARPRRDGLLLVVDVTAGLLGALALAAEQRGPLWVVALAAGVGGWHARAARRGPALTVPGALAEAPGVWLRTAVAWTVFGTVVAALVPAHGLPPRTLALGCATHALVSCAGRAVVYARRRAGLARRPHPVLVIGDARAVRRVAAALLRHPRCGVRPVGTVAAGPLPPGPPVPAPDAAGPPALHTVDDVRRALVQHGVRHVLVTGSEALRGQAPLLRVLTGYGRDLWHLDPAPAGPSPVGRRAPRLAGFPHAPLAPHGPRRTPIRKRTLDMALSGLLLLLAAPVLALCATVIRLVDGPGVLFRQERIGRGGRPFTLLKFRTLRPADPREAATRWNVADDGRISTPCRFLRRTSLDELPQLWNVFRGDMSLVGPRPERPYFVGQFSRTYDGYADRHRMPSGITGLAQVEGLRGDTSIEDRARFDNAYIDTWSLWQDVCILLRTAAVLIRPTGG
ncbi:exopolysaccharide biosynthesis polyprenyl glycosylphosphotransferase [Streptomyces sp. NPDC049906]|uniref:exopolysaccharide biosynthesis polyprenyl glycosylphosphotransferase n=1 Tax=Streptomyces sp. NPDC049906 TaxID=3155656 RepID=UPI003423600E